MGQTVWGIYFRGWRTALGFQCLSLRILPGGPLAGEAPILQSTPVLRRLTRKQAAAAGYKPHSLGSGAQDKNTSLEGKLPIKWKSSGRSDHTRPSGSSYSPTLPAPSQLQNPVGESAGSTKPAPPFPFKEKPARLQPTDLSFLASQDRRMSEILKFH